MEVHAWDPLFRLMDFHPQPLQEVGPFACEGVAVLEFFLLIELHEDRAEVPELVVRDAALGLLVDFAPLFSGPGDELPCDFGVFQVLHVQVAVHNDADENGHQKHVEGEVESGEEDDGEDGSTTPILAVLLELLI